MLLQTFYSVRSERHLMERLEFDLLFRWFVGLGIDDPVWDHSTFSKNRDRLLDGAIAARFLSTLLAQPKVKRPLSTDHFSVDGTLIQAWASTRPFRPTGRSDYRASFSDHNRPAHRCSDRPISEHGRCRRSRVDRRHAACRACPSADAAQSSKTAHPSAKTGPDSSCSLSGAVNHNPLMIPTLLWVRTLAFTALHLIVGMGDRESD